MAKVMQAVYAAKSASESAQIELEHAGGPKADEYKRRWKPLKRVLTKLSPLRRNLV